MEKVEKLDMETALPQQYTERSAVRIRTVEKYCGRAGRRSSKEWYSTRNDIGGTRRRAPELQCAQKD